MEKLPPGIHLKSSEHMDEIEDGSVTLVVTSPPYNVDLAYEKGQSFDDWLVLMRSVLNECNRVLKDGGRACINVASTGRTEDHDDRPKGYTPLFKYVIDIASELGWWMRGMIIWFKGIEPDPETDVKAIAIVSKTSTAWGSYAKATNPILRDSHEFILVFNKGKESIQKGKSGIIPDEFISFTKAEWFFQPVTGIDHPAPFPEELPRRCILLYSNEGDIVLDPFGGSGTTFKVARHLGRKPVMYEKNPDYAEVISKRIAEPIMIQSKAWDDYHRVKARYPDLFDKPTRELRDMLKRSGVKSTGSLNKYQLMEAIEKTRRATTLIDFISGDGHE